MVGCSKQKKADCVGPHCAWIVGKGCKAASKPASSPKLPVILKSGDYKSSYFMDRYRVKLSPSGLRYALKIVSDLLAKRFAALEASDYSKKENRASFLKGWTRAKNDVIESMKKDVKWTDGMSPESLKNFRFKSKASSSSSDFVDLGDGRLDALRNKNGEPLIFDKKAIVYFSAIVDRLLSELVWRCLLEVNEYIYDFAYEKSHFVEALEKASKLYKEVFAPAWAS